MSNLTEHYEIPKASEEEVNDFITSRLEIAGELQDASVYSTKHYPNWVKSMKKARKLKQREKDIYHNSVVNGYEIPLGSLVSILEARMARLYSEIKPIEPDSLASAVEAYMDNNNYDRQQLHFYATACFHETGQLLSFLRGSLAFNQPNEHTVGEWAGMKLIDIEEE